MGFRGKKFFLKFLVDILPFGSESVDPHIFADPGPDPGSQNLADSTDPDPKQGFRMNICCIHVLWTIKTHNLSLTVVFLFNSLTGLTIVGLMCPPSLDYI